MPTKNKVFFSTLFCSLLSVGTITSDFKDKKSLRNHETAEIEVFNNFLLVDGYKHKNASAMW
jgi:hypothetical protein